ncbi:hypothetical protein [Fusobacterium hwasookii]|uniref:Lipoprotein n=1 Tax=Fusobacterium hwasookii ChDC F128 TaxID=1216362 RepID=A0ABN0H0D2_9FUSO|nr:hypothetical protein [Fusobacterium hwasookii]EJU07717.1 hypothetical protein B437_06335 [Fusobacterium hwasookii ChDC F128]QNE66378.1 hypothetical protein H5V36_00075 [Fusobacterium hwasookii]
MKNNKVVAMVGNNNANGEVTTTYVGRDGITRESIKLKVDDGLPTGDWTIFDDNGNSIIESKMMKIGEDLYSGEMRLGEYNIKGKVYLTTKILYEIPQDYLQYKISNPNFDYLGELARAIIIDGTIENELGMIDEYKNNQIVKVNDISLGNSEYNPSFSGIYIKDLDTNIKIDAIDGGSLDNVLLTMAEIKGVGWVIIVGDSVYDPFAEEEGSTNIYTKNDFENGAKILKVFRTREELYDWVHQNNVILGD